VNTALAIATIRIACPATGGAFAHGIGHATNPRQQQTGEHIAPGGGGA